MQCGTLDSLGEGVGGLGVRHSIVLNACGSAKSGNCHRQRCASLVSSTFTTEQDVADTEIENESDEEEAQLSGGVDVCSDADMAL